MKIVIIEDEKITAEDLVDLIVKLQPNAQIVATLNSVKEAQHYFRTHSMPDLIFSDIQLGDGLSFDIFKSVEVTAPIIFCTAYDEYAFNAFRTTGIDYILKPIVSSTVEQALKKYQTLRKEFNTSAVSYDSILDLFANKPLQKTLSILVTQKDKIIPIKMEELERICSDDFFRVNRQCLVNRTAVKDAAHFFSRKLIINLSVPFKETITISKEKTPQFLDWLARK